LHKLPRLLMVERHSTASKSPITNSIPFRTVRSPLTITEIGPQGLIMADGIESNIINCQSSSLTIVLGFLLVAKRGTLLPHCDIIEYALVPHT